TPATTWKSYAEPDFPNPDFTDCPLDFSEVDVNHVAFVYFSDTTDGFSSSSPTCIAHVKPYSQLATDLASRTACTPALIASGTADRKSTRLNSSHEWISYAVFCLK